MEIAKNILKSSSVLPSLGVSTAALAANAAVSAGSGVNMAGEILFPNIATSALIGSGVGFLGSKGGTFTGMFGYKSLLRGIEKPKDMLTAGGLMLPVIEAAARLSVKAGAKSSFAVGAASIRQLGVSGLFGNLAAGIPGYFNTLGNNELLSKSVLKIFNEVGISNVKAPLKIGNKYSMYTMQEAIKKGVSKDAFIAGITKAKGTSAKPGMKAIASKLSGVGSKGIGSAYTLLENISKSKIFRFMAGAAGRDLDDVLSNFKIVEKTVGQGTHRFLSLKGAASPAFLKGGKIAMGINMVNLVMITAMAGNAAIYGGGKLLEGGAAGLAYGVDQAMQAQRLDLGSGRMNPVYMSQGAQTERQRAIKAIYGAKVNPSQRMFGNEGRNMHR